MNLAAEAMDVRGSPDIGSPPISQFVDADPIKIDLPSRAQKVENATEVELDTLLHTENQISPSAEPLVRRPSRFEPTKASGRDSLLSQTGAKRKLSVRDDEDVTNHETPLTEIPQEQAASSPVENLTIPLVAPASSAPITAIAKRKVLAPKSVNNSPRKSASSKVISKPGVTPITAEDRCVKTKRPLKNGRQDLPKSNTQPSIQKVVPVIVTPAAVDIFSTSSGPTGQLASRDTPPPSTSLSVTEGQRPSRRIRASVNYAQPNLRDKMRRPTKELVDAVVGNKSLVSHIKIEKDREPIPSEACEDEDWKSLPLYNAVRTDQSPLSGQIQPSNLISGTAEARSQRNARHDTKPDISEAESCQPRMESPHAKPEGAHKKPGQAPSETQNSIPADIYDLASSKDLPIASVRVSRRQSIRKSTAGDDEEEDYQARGQSSSQFERSIRRRQSCASVTERNSDDTGKGLEALKRTSGLTSVADHATKTREAMVVGRRKSTML